MSQKSESTWGFSPDVGHYERVGTTYYFATGHVHDTDVNGPLIMRAMPVDSGESYSTWTEEKRAAVAEQHRLEAAEYMRKEHEKLENMKRLAAIAKTKLTEEEYIAVLQMGSY